jgi:hypothetical protein
MQLTVENAVPRWYLGPLDELPAWDRPDGRELLWVCLECRQHYPRSELPPERCNGCGASRTAFYAHIED